MTRAFLVLCACWLVGCGDDPPATAPVNPSPMNDAQISPALEGGALEDHITVPVEPRDAAITEPTPILDLPLVIARPSEPLSTARLEVMVVDPEGQPIAEVSVSTGGPAVFTNSYGLASVSDVYGTGFTNVYAFSAGRTLAHARIPIRAGEASYVVLASTVRTVERLEDLAEGGVVATDEAIATFEPGSFERPWAGSAVGPAVVGLTVLAGASQAAAVPAGMQALVDGQLTQVRGTLAFELSVTQGATELELVKPVDVTFLTTTVDASSQTLYAFDPKAGAFVPRGELLQDLTRLTAKIDRAGYWLLGSHGAPVRCARVATQSGGSPVARAGVLLTLPEGFSAARVEADAQGSACALLPEHTGYDAQAFGPLGGGFVLARGSIAAGAAAVCDETCEASVLEGEPFSFGCARVTISMPWQITMPTTPVTETDSLGERSRQLPLNVPFCVDARVGAQLAIAGNCTGGGVISINAPAVPGASCGDETACADLGTITCCDSIELCYATGDEDCDGVVDEGCTCGGGDCSWSNAPNRCCTTAATCGQRSPFSEDCINYEPVVTPTTCPGAYLELASAAFESVPGCCRSSGECGLSWGTVGCVAAADVPLAWGPQATLASVECTP